MRWAVTAALALLAIAAACSGEDDATQAPSTATTAVIVPPPSVGPPAPLPSSASPPAPTAPAPPPTRIEDDAVDVGVAWPPALGTPGPTRLQGLVAGSGDARPGDGEVVPPTPDVPHGYRAASGGPFTARVTVYAYPDAATAAAWASSWAQYGQRPPIERHDGRTLLQPAPVPDDGSGWSGLVLDRLEQPGETGTWTRTVHLTRAVGARVARVEVTWSGAMGAEVPDLVPAGRALAAAQDAHLAAQPPAVAGVGAGADIAARRAPLETLLGWRALLAEPGVDPPRRWAEQTTVSPTAMPAGAAQDGAIVYAERYLIGNDFSPVVIAVLAYPSPEGASAAVARWNAAPDGFGPFTFAGLGLGDVTWDLATLTPVANVPSSGVASAAAGANGATLAGAWFALGARAYAMVAGSAEVAQDLARQQAALAA